MVRRPARLSSLVAGMMLAMSAAAHAASDAELERIVDQRLQGDRTGACFAVAVIDGDSVSRAWRCADPAAEGRIGPDTAFEIGSVSKTMTAALLADLIEQGRASLDDPIGGYLPEGVAAPEFEGRPILLRHLVTHTSGLPPLPSRLNVTDLVDPYAALTAEDLLASLEDVSLAQAPGERFEYNNFASMLLSWIVARRAGADFETLLKERLFGPLGMRHAYVNQPPEGVRVATGHLPGGQETSAWHFATDLAGVGGVRATLDDMVRYAQAQLGRLDVSIASALELSQQPVANAADAPFAMNWGLAPLDGRTVHAHEGGTGGFSSQLVFDRERQRAVVVLSDTALTAFGGLGSLGNHLLDDRLPLGRPRREAQAPGELLDALAGEYRLNAGMTMTLARSGDALVLRMPGQPEIELGYDDAGDFYPVGVDALLTPRERPDGSYAFVWHQGGGAMSATRVEADGGQAAPPPPPEALRVYAGTYPLMPGFDLVVREHGGGLHAQATGQGEFPLAFAGDDVFRADAFGIEIRFERGADGAVSSLELHQGVHVLHGEKR